MKIKVLSWNIWGGKHLADVIEFLKTADADIIALQEVIEEEHGNNAITIAKELGYECVYSLAMNMSSNWSGPAREKEVTIGYGNAILSKHKIVSSKAHEMSNGESRVAMQADILVNNETLHVFSIHLKHDHWIQSNPADLALQNGQIDNLIKVLPPEKTLVMGDFNAIGESYVLTQISSMLQNTEHASDTPTWSVYPEGCTLCKVSGIRYKLDYIFASKDLKAGSFAVHSSKASDHLPVSAIVEL